MTRHHSCRVSPFGHPRIHARLTTPRGISQPPTSFIGSQCQGIHHAPLNTYNTKNQFEKNCTSNTHNNNHQPRKTGSHPCVLDARNHYPQIKHHTPPPKQGDNQVLSPVSHTGQRDNGPVASKPNSVSGNPSPAPIPTKRTPAAGSTFVAAPEPDPLQVNGPSSRIAQNTEPPHDVGGPESRGAP